MDRLSGRSALFFGQSIRRTRESGFHGDRGNEPVAAARQGFKKCRIRRAVSQRLAGFDCYAQALVEIDEGVAGPRLLTQFLTRDNLPALFQQESEELKRLVLQFDPQSVARERERTHVECEKAEAIDDSRSSGFISVRVFHLKAHPPEGPPSLSTPRKCATPVSERL